MPFLCCDWWGCWSRPQAKKICFGQKMNFWLEGMDAWYLCRIYVVLHAEFNGEGISSLGLTVLEISRLKVGVFSHRFPCILRGFNYTVSRVGLKFFCIFSIWRNRLWKNFGAIYYPSAVVQVQSSQKSPYFPMHFMWPRSLSVKGWINVVFSKLDT